jgi:ADP-heptose:LPS heptosyltransferase
MVPAPRLLFVPVSAARGTGEYARCVLIANAARERWPRARIHFVVSREAPYADRVPFDVTLLPSSPTFHVPEVRALIDRFRPHVVVFDNAGRSSQLAAARAAGARTVYVSSRVGRRRRAFRPQWLMRLDEHWIAYPEIIAGPLGWLERLLLRLLRGPQVRFLATLMPREDPQRAAAVLQRFGLIEDRYVLIAPGGGTSHRDMPHVPDIIAAAAVRIAARGIQTVLLGIAPPAGVEVPAALVRVPALPTDELVALIRAARVVVSNGADTLVQVMACGQPCVAVPMSPDQSLRLRRFEEAGVPVGVPLAQEAIVAGAMQLLENSAARELRAREVTRLGFRNELDTALDALGRLVDRSTADTVPRID